MTQSNPTRPPIPGHASPSVEAVHRGGKGRLEIGLSGVFPGPAARSPGPGAVHRGDGGGLLLWFASDRPEACAGAVRGGHALPASAALDASIEDLCARLDDVAAQLGAVQSVVGGADAVSCLRPLSVTHLPRPDDAGHGQSVADTSATDTMVMTVIISGVRRAPPPDAGCVVSVLVSGLLAVDRQALADGFMDVVVDVPVPPETGGPADVLQHPGALLGALVQLAAWCGRASGQLRSDGRR